MAVGEVIQRVSGAVDTLVHMPRVLSDGAATSADNLLESRGVALVVFEAISHGASGPQLQGSLGSIGLRPMPPHCSRDPAHGLVVGNAQRWQCARNAKRAR
jgi:hypothetical protein